MTNKELHHILTTGSGGFTISMQKENIFLECDGGRHEITEDQASLIWDHMFAIAMIRRDNTPTELKTR